MFLNGSNNCPFLDTDSQAATEGFEEFYRTLGDVKFFEYGDAVVVRLN